MSQPPPEITTVKALLWHLWPLLLGNVLEWYDFGIYSFLAPNMKVLFFHSSSISTWAGYTVTFLLRPCGGFLNGWLADKYGRRVAVLVSIVGMLVATVGQGLLPTYLCCGNGWGTVGLVLLLVLRAMQGLSAGGELGPIVAYFAETAPPNRMRAATGFLLASAGLGFLSANLLVVLVVHSLSDEAMQAWGWRIPFLASLVPGSIALWGRSKLTESAEFSRMMMELAEEHEQDSSQLRPPLHKQLLAVVVGFLATCATAVSYYSGLWSPSYLKSIGLDDTDALLAGCVFTGIVMITWLLLPLLNDLLCGCDPLNFMLLGALTVAATSFSIFQTLSRDRASAFTALACYGLVVGLCGSHLYISVADLFPTPTRALGFGMSCNLAFAVLGGTAPLLDAALLEIWTPGVGLYWAVAGLVTALTAALGLCLRRSGHLPSRLLAQKVRVSKSCDSKSLAEASEEVQSGDII